MTSRWSRRNCLRYRYIASKRLADRQFHGAEAIDKRPVSVGNRRMTDFGSEPTLTDSPMRGIGSVISFDARHSIAPGCDRRVSILQLIESEL